MLATATTVLTIAALAFGAGRVATFVDGKADEMGEWLETSHSNAQEDLPAIVPETPPRPMHPRVSIASKKGDPADPVSFPKDKAKAKQSPPPKSESAAISTASRKKRPHFPQLVPSLTAPPCEEISAYIITVFEDPQYSRATLSINPKTSGAPRWVGQTFGNHRVIAIDYNARSMSSAVWLAQGDEVCQVLLRDRHPVRERLQENALRKRSKVARAEARKRAKRAKRKARKHRSKKRRAAARRRR
jgi:hypothetical protein